MNPSKLIGWSAVAGVVGTTAVLSSGLLPSATTPAVVHASPSVSAYDSDGDGLPNEIENYLGTLPDQADSDGDGFQDGEEFARHSDPLDMGSVPQSEKVGVAMAIYEEGKSIRPVIAVYAMDGNARAADLMVGVRVGSQMRNLPLSFFSKNAKLGSAPTVSSTAAITIFDGTMKSNQVKRFGSLSIYGTGSYRGTVVSADALNLFDVGGVIVSRFVTSSASAANKNKSSWGNISTGAYKPLTGGGQAPPPSWAGGSVCSQTLATAGASGSVVSQEVVSAGCATGWDSYCDGAACAATVGSTIKLVDPISLIGG